MEPAQVKALEEIVNQLKEDPTLVYGPELVFFKDFLLSWGAKIPAASAPKASPGPAPEKKETPPPAEKEAEEEEEEEEPDEPEEEDPDRLPEDPEPFPEKSPSNELELTDAQMDKQAEAKQAGVEAIEDGDMKKAVEKYTEAIKIGNVSAMMYTKRAELLLKQKRPCASIADCDSALDINPDSAKAYRIRGKAYRLIGKWEKAHKDLALAQSLDFDDDVVEMQKLVDSRWKKIEAKQNAQRIKQEARDKKRREADMKQRKEQATREYEEQKKRDAMGGGMGGGFPGMPGGMGGFPGMGGMGGMGGMPGMPAGMDPSMFSHLLSDPELMAAFQDPKMQAAMQDIMSNPGNISKYQNDPEIMRLISKVGSAFGGGMPGGMPGGMGGMGGGAPPPSSGPSFEEVDEID